MSRLTRTVHASLVAVALGSLATPACTLGGNAEATGAPGGAAPDVPETAALVGDGALASSLAYDDEAFRAAVAAVAARHGASAAALPYAHVLPGAVSDAVRGVVASAVGVEPRSVVEEPLECGSAGRAACAERFIFSVTGFDGALAEDLAPLARSLAPLARDVRASAWTPKAGGEALAGAVTLHGHVGGRLVGVVVFR